jgi:myo-inositol 2-dehydrogenase / D-chiro-inositol 1-dehydrogenase
MSDLHESHAAGRSSRRDFFRTSSALVAAGALAGGLSISRSAYAAGNDVLKIGLVGCGGRGTGAAVNALAADANCKLVALADVFDDRLQSSLENLKQQFPEKVAVDREHCFLGFDSGKKLINSGVDVVILGEPPHFRPENLKTAIAAGKHVFCEKPVAVDAPGVRSILATVEEAKKKNLSIVSGLCWRYDVGVQETMKRVLDGAVGDIISIQSNYLAAPLSYRPRQPNWTEMEYQLRNWQYFVWLSGDFNNEQHVHSLDKAAWALGEATPLRAWGIGGQQLRNPKECDVWDHHAVTYEFPGGVHVHSYCRQMPGCPWDVSDIVFGTKGRANVLERFILDQKGKKTWRYKGAPAGAHMYDAEHEKFFAAIRSGQTINNGLYMAHSTMMAILGRLVDYTGQPITWEEVMNSQQTLAPAKYAMDATPPVVPGADGRYPAAIPGATRFV